MEKIRSFFLIGIRRVGLMRGVVLCIERFALRIQILEENMPGSQPSNVKQSEVEAIPRVIDFLV